MTDTTQTSSHDDTNGSSRDEVDGIGTSAAADSDQLPPVDPAEGTGNHEGMLGGGPGGGVGSPEKDPADWATGGEPITGPQRSYLDTLAREAGEELPADMTKAEASQHIERLQEKTGRGKG